MEVPRDDMDVSAAIGVGLCGAIERHGSPQTRPDHPGRRFLDRVGVREKSQAGVGVGQEGLRRRRLVGHVG